MMLNVLLCQLLLMAADPAERKLQVGSPFPVVTGKTISGAPLELPNATAGKPQILVFSFSRAGGLDSRHWNERLAADSSVEASKFNVIVLESVPRLFRSAAVSGIKGNMPPGLWPKTILLFKDEALWKERLAVSADSHCYVVLLDDAARISWMSTGPFSEKEYAELQSALTLIGS
jgi:hypothetical protein